MILNSVKQYAMDLKFTDRKRGLIGLALVMILSGSWLLHRATAGLVVETGNTGGRPYQLIRPQETLEKRPLVLVAHGLAGSGTIMNGLALKLAWGGYDVLTWDFDGHGRNPYPMEVDIYSPWLLSNVEEVLEAVSDHPELDTSRIAIVGHSMGTAAALTFAQVHANTRATVAISPVRTAVTPELPQNLLLLAGQLEPDFVEYARDRLAEAGGVGGDIQAGTARDFQIIPDVEHISILFSSKTHTTVLNWLDQTFGIQKGAKSYVDRRLQWYVLIIVGTLILAANVLLASSSRSLEKSTKFHRASLIMLISSIGATLLLRLFEYLGLSLNTLFGIRAGGYLVLWFLVSGSIGLTILKPLKFPPVRVEVLNGLLVFVLLWLGIGLAGDAVWLPWLLISKRLILWPLVVIALLPWTLMMGMLSADWGAGKSLLWWLVQSVVLFGALLLAIKLSPSLGFLMLLLPVFPVILLFQAIPNLQSRGGWTYAISGAFFVSWLLLAVFPLI